MKVRKMWQFHMLYRCLICVFLLGMQAFFVTGCSNKVEAPVYNEDVEPADDVSMLAVVCNVDDVNEKIKVRQIGQDAEKELVYTGGTDVRDSHDDLMPMSQVELGSVVDIVYDANRDKLESLHMTSDANITKLESVDGAVIDPVNNTIRVDNKTYQMSDSVCAFSENTEIGLDEICSEDQIALWLYNNVVYSVYVELGHGYVRLSDYASYIGGMVEIGYDVIVPVTEDMLLTVREGTYTLRIAKGDGAGTKEVTVVKNQETDLSLADIAIEPKQMGSVLFKVTPSDAAVYIDSRRVNTEGAVDITFGKHRINIIAEGYQSYSASFNVNYAYKVKEYTLQKEDETTESASSTTTAENAGESTTATSEATTQTSTTDNSDVKDVTTSEGTKTKNKVTVSAPVGASVYFDGQYLGIAPISFTKVTGSHIITLSQTGYLSKSYTVNFTDDGKDSPLKYDELISISSLIE